jgi:putative transposase
MPDKTDSDAENKEVSLNRQKLSFEPDSFVIFESKVYRFKEVINFNIALCIDVETGRTHTLQISKLQPMPIGDEALYAVASQDVEEISDNSLKEAMRRYDILKPLFESGKPSRSQIIDRANESKVHFTTIYRWLKRYKSLDSIMALIQKKKRSSIGTNQAD